MNSSREAVLGALGEPTPVGQVEMLLEAIDWVHDESRRGWQTEASRYDAREAVRALQSAILQIVASGLDTVGLQQCLELKHFKQFEPYTDDNEKDQ